MSAPPERNAPRHGPRYRYRRHRGPLRKLWGVRHQIQKVAVRLGLAVGTLVLAFLVRHVLRILSQPPPLP
jgi:hypothetical protein